MNATPEATIAWTPCPADRDVLIGRPGGYAITTRRRDSGAVWYFSVTRYGADESWTLITITGSRTKAKAAAEAHLARTRETAR